MLNPTGNIIPQNATGVKPKFSISEDKPADDGKLVGEAADKILVMQESKGRLKYRDGKSMDDWKGAVQNLWKDNPNLDKQKSMML